MAGLQEAGRVYPCVCSRKDIQNALRAPHAEDRGSGYPGTCRDRFADHAAAARWESANAARLGRRPVGAALRLRVQQGPVRFDDLVMGPREVDVAGAFGDFVVRRKDGAFAYMYAVVLDDIAMGVSEVVRGDDLVDCTAQQLIVAQAIARHSGDPGIRALAAGSVPRFAHVPLVYGDDGRRLAKRDRSLHVGNLQERGIDPSRLMRWLSLSLGTGDTADLHEMAGRFCWARVRRQGVLFGVQELAAMAEDIYSPSVRFVA